MHSCSVIEDSGGGSVSTALGGPTLGLSPTPTNGPFDDGGSCLVAIAALITEGRMPPPAALTKRPPFTEGPHCAFSKRAGQHVCNGDDELCVKYEKIKSYVNSLWQKNIPLCVQVLLVPKCCCEEDLFCDVSSTILEQIGSAVLLEEWLISCIHRRTHDLTNLNIIQLINAIRSQLYFSQITAWLASPDEKIQKSFPNNRIVYCLTIPGETYGCKKFATNAQQHNFPMADIGSGIILKVQLSNLPRSEQEIPTVQCSKCNNSQKTGIEIQKSNSCNNNENSKVNNVLDDRMQTYCTLKGKHHCEEIEDYENLSQHARLKQLLKDRKNLEPNLNKPSTSKNLSKKCQNQNRKNQNQNQNQKQNGPSSSQVKNFQNQLLSCLNDENICQNKVSMGSKSTLMTSCQCPSETETVTKPKTPTQSNHDLINKGDILLNAIMRPKNNLKNVDKCASSDYGTFSSKNNSVFLERNKRKCVNKQQSLSRNNISCDIKKCDLNSDSDIKNNSDNFCDTNKRKKKNNDVTKMKDISNIFSIEYIEKRQKVKVKQKLTFDDPKRESESDSKSEVNVDSVDFVDIVKNSDSEKLILIPSASDQAKFRKNLDNAASMVFHSRTGLPLTSSPAPVRRGKCFDFDSSINSVSAIRSALFSLAPNCSTDDDSESDCSIVSPCSPDALSNLKPCKVAPYKHRRGQTGLLGSFEESVLNGRLEPVSTVHGFTAELGASGSFCPRHAMLPVTVFFYTLGDNDKVSTPYLGHINLGKKGYNVPKSGTIQVTLFNPLGTVVKMFVIMYDLSDMPPNSQTFIRQRTLYMPANLNEKDVQWSQKWLRYLIHLRFMSSKSGRIYLHSDIRMIICRKSDLDTATAHGIDMSYELRSFTHSPTNPKFSPRK